MTGMLIRSQRSYGLILLGVLAACPSAAWAGGGYDDKEFGVRLPPAFVRFTEVSTLGGDTAANRMSSSINPAAAGWLNLPNKWGLVVAPAYGVTAFDSGTNVHVMSEAASWDSRTWGTFQPIFNQIRTNRDVDRQGLGFGYDVDTYMLQWGKRFDKLGIGASTSFSEAEVSNRLGSMTVSDAHAENYRFRLGALYEPVEKWLAGMIFEYGFSPFRSKALAFTPLGPMEVQQDGTEQQYIFRPAVSYEYAPMSTVFADFEHGDYHTETDRLRDDRFSVGVDHRLLEWLFLRTTGSFDSRGNMGWSCGATVFLAQWCSLDLGYQYDMFPELRPEFGRSNTFQATLALRF